MRQEPLIDEDSEIVRELLATLGSDAFVSSATATFAVSIPAHQPAELRHALWLLWRTRCNFVAVPQPDGSMDITFSAAKGTAPESALVIFANPQPAPAFAYAWSVKTLVPTGTPESRALMEPIIASLTGCPTYHLQVTDEEVLVQWGRMPDHLADE